MLIGGIILAAAQSYYVASTGSDANPGTISQPWQTISKVNAHVFVPGDNIYFHGGDTFSGNLVAQPSSPPTLSQPVLISSYGTGKAEIDCGDGDGVKVINAGYTTVSNLKIVGSGFTNSGGHIITTAIGAGVRFTYDTASTTYHNISILNCDLIGTGQCPYVTNTNSAPTACLDGVLISGNTCTAVPGYGIYFRADGVPGGGDLPGQIFLNVIVENNTVNDLPGNDPTSGFPLVLYNCASPIIRGNWFNNCGYGLNTSNQVCMLVVNTTAPWIHHNEISNFTSSSGNDGHGIDLDIGTTDAVVEYNYCHDSDRYGLYNFAGVRSTFRYNIVERCLGAYVFVSGDSKVYQNSFYSTAAGHEVISSGAADKIYNNIIVAPSGTKHINAFNGVVVIGNTYYTTNGDGTFLVNVNGTDYASLSAFRTAGYEKVSSTNYGTVGDPQFTAPGGGTQQLPTNPVSHLAAYDIASGSAARAVGVDLSSRSITPPTTDWHGNPASTGTNPDAGAVAFGSH